MSKLIYKTQSKGKNTFTLKVEPYISRKNQKHLAFEEI